MYTADESWSLGPLESNSPALPVSTQSRYFRSLFGRSNLLFLVLVLLISKVE